jgi:hypothetical protein
MTPSLETVISGTPSNSKIHVMFGNGHTFRVSHVGNTSVEENIDLNNVLIIPHLQKNLLSVGK